MPQVMKNTTGLTHTGCGHDDMGCLIPIKRNGFFNRTDKINPLKLKRIFALLEKCFMGLLVVGFRMFYKYPSNIGGQGAVNVYREAGDIIFDVKLVQNVKEFLGSTESKGRNHNRPTAIIGFHQHLFELGL